MVPRYFRTDAGREYKNSHVGNLFKKMNIAHRFGKHQHKAALAENSVRRTMKKLSRYFIYKNTYRYVDILPRVEQALNATPLRSLQGQSPESAFKNARAKPETGYDLWLRTVRSRTKRMTTVRDDRRVEKLQRQLNAGDAVRVSIEPHPFRKGYAKNFSREIFFIHRVIKRQPVWMFTLKDQADDILDGNFYPDEILKVASPQENTLYQIERVLNKRYNKKTKSNEYLVRFKGYGKEFDKFVDEKQIVNISSDG